MQPFHVLFVASVATAGLAENASIAVGPNLEEHPHSKEVLHKNASSFHADLVALTENVTTSTVVANMNNSTVRSGLGNGTYARGNLRGSANNFVHSASSQDWYYNKNCYSGQGGDNIDDDSNVRNVGSEYGCSQYCDSTWNCKCATFEPSSGRCWRLRWCNIGQCPYDPQFKVYQSSGRGHSPSPSPPSSRWYYNTNCYSGRGGDNIDDDSNVRYTGSEYSCSQYCDSTWNCKCATFEPSSGRCWRLRWCNIGQCQSEGGFNVYFR